MQRIQKLEHVLLAFNGDGDGQLKGAQAQYFERGVDDDGTEVYRKMGKATAINPLLQDGEFSWPVIAAQVNIQLAATVEAKDAALEAQAAVHAQALDEKQAIINAREETITTLTGERDAKIDELATANSRISELEAQIATLQGSPEPGVIFVKKWQLRTGFRIDGLFETHMTYIESVVNNNDALRDFWNDSTGVLSSSPLVPVYAAHFGETVEVVLARMARYSRVTEEMVYAVAAGQPVVLA